MNHAKQVLASLTLGLPMLVWGVSAANTVSAHPTVTAVVGQAAPDDHPEMPNAPGKAITIQTCTKCHSITNVTGQHKDADAWTATITKMVGYGATGTDDEFQQILDYVTKYYGVNPPPADGKTPPPADKSTPPAAPHAKIVINKETPAQLALDLRLTSREARSIVSYREKNGAFKSVDDLKKVAAVDAKKIDAKKNDLLFS